MDWEKNRNLKKSNHYQSLPESWSSTKDNHLYLKLSFVSCLLFSISVHAHPHSHLSCMLTSVSWYNFLVWWFSLCGEKISISLSLTIWCKESVDWWCDLESPPDLDHRRKKRNQKRELDYSTICRTFLSSLHVFSLIFSSLRVSVTRKFIPFEKVNGNTHTTISQLTWLTWLHLSVNIICME